MSRRNCERRLCRADVDVGARTRTGQDGDARATFGLPWPAGGGSVQDHTPRSEEAAMLSREDNEVLCRVGRGSPMGDLMRQYWIPALTSDELPGPDCPPVRVRLLGENL